MVALGETEQISKELRHSISGLLCDTYIIGVCGIDFQSLVWNLEKLWNRFKRNFTNFALRLIIETRLLDFDSKSWLNFTISNKFELKMFNLLTHRLITKLNCHFESPCFLHSEQPTFEF